LRLSFRRTFSDEMMQLWSELVDVIDNISLTEESDALIWCIWSHVSEFVGYELGISGHM
jgi:hypothetical protein